MKNAKFLQAYYTWLQNGASVKDVELASVETSYHGWPYNKNSFWEAYGLLTSQTTLPDLFVRHLRQMKGLTLDIGGGAHHCLQHAVVHDLALHKLKHVRMNTAAHAVHHDISKPLPYVAGAFASSVLVNITPFVDLNNLLKELKRVTMPGGMVAIADTLAYHPLEKIHFVNQYGVQEIYTLLRTNKFILEQEIICNDKAFLIKAVCPY